MMIETPLEIGQTVYYWTKYAIVSTINISRFGASSFEWHLCVGSVRYIRIDVVDVGCVHISYFVDGMYRNDYDVFLSEEEGMEKGHPK